MSNAQSLGGQVMAKRQRDAAISKYLLNPNTCLFCGKVILVRDIEKVSDVRKKKFCNNHCSARFNNPKRAKIGKIINCKNCGKEVSLKYVRNQYLKRKYCDDCRFSAPREYKTNRDVSLRAKGELFNSRKNWQSARSDIRRNASRVYKRSGKPYSCFVCCYEKHTEICYKKAVSEFSDDSLVKEINAIENLVALCPNHHWEQDHGLLKI